MTERYSEILRDVDSERGLSGKLLQRYWKDLVGQTRTLFDAKYTHRNEIELTFKRCRGVHPRRDGVKGGGRNGSKRSA